MAGRRARKISLALPICGKPLAHTHTDTHNGRKRNERVNKRIIFPPLPDALPFLDFFAFFPPLKWGRIDFIAMVREGKAERALFIYFGFLL